MNQKDKLMLFGIYSKLLSDGRYYATKQTRYRVIASTWLFATLAASGVLMSSEEILPFDHLLAVVIVCFLGALAIYAIWYEDTVALETLLDISVIDALRLEKQHTFLPQLHHRFLKLFLEGTTPHVKSVFFVGCKSILMSLVTIALAIYLYKFSLVFSVISIVLTVFLNILSTKTMTKKNLQINHLMEEIQNVGS